ncbi:MAG: tetratricopeptide repeat protein [Acidobacteria bacterium]|nr:tetratricopeptide repeat protein [Acidobacteriota bacterium]
MKRLFNYALLAMVLVSAAVSAPAQTRGGARKGAPQRPQAKPTATPAPTPAPAQTIAETPLQPGQRARFDVNHYRVIAELNPAQHLLTATADVTFTPLDNTRSVVFELNGSLKVESVERGGKVLTNVVQDQAGLETIGPFVRVDLGEVVPAGQQQTLRFRWSGALVTPEGGPLLTKRLAYVGPEMSYLLYAARWFPFHEYAADRATSDFTISVPTGYTVAGASEEPVAELSGAQFLPPAGAAVGGTAPARTTAQGAAGLRSYRFVTRQPSLVGSFAVGRFVTRTLKMGGYELTFHVQPGSESFIDPYAQLVGEALQFYTQKYGPPAFGTRLSVVQIDDASLDAYAAPGIQFLSPRFFTPGRQASLDERLLREVAYQWWGLTVGLKSFDDVWLSQGLAEWSSFAFRENRLTGGQLDLAQRDMLERALMFEQASSVARAPSTLDDQSAAYQAVVFYKGAMVFRMLRETMRPAKFDELLKRYASEFRGRNASIDDFEKLTTAVNGENMRYFFARWVEGTGVPEFSVDYQIIRTRSGKFRARGTVKQNVDNLRMPVELQLRAEGDDANTVVFVADRSEDFDFEVKGKPLEVIIDPNNKVMRSSEELRISIVARRGLELFREGQYLEAQRQLEEALKLDKSNSWVYYNLGLIFLEQRNYQQALDNFQAAIDGNLRPTWIEAWARIKRGNAYDAQGDRGRAVTEYRKAVESGIDFDGAQRAAKEYLKTPYDPKSATQQAASGVSD